MPLLGSSPASRFGTALVTAALLLTGCTATSPAERKTTPITWSPCGTALECGTVPVPLEYTESDDKQIALTVMRHPATDPAQRIGTLFFNPGGPGYPATELMKTLDSPTGMFSPDVLARFDIIGVDPRGVGRSSGVRCLTDDQRADAVAADFDPAIPGGKPLPRLLADATAFTRGCADHQSRAFLASLSTDNVARDLDQVRAAIGEEQISFYGTSYGTVVGRMYATLFPDRVRQVVLDAPVDTGRWFGDPLAFLNEVAVASERTLDAWLATCRAEGVRVCPFGDGNPGAALDTLLTRLEAKPLPVKPVAGLTPGGTLDGARALEAVRAAAGAAVTWPVLTAALLGAQRGDGALLHFLWTAVTLSPFPVPTALNEVHTAVRCADWNTPADVAAHTAAARDVVEQAKRVGTRAAYSALNCARWPAPNTDRFTAPLTGAGAPPTLVIGGRLDPATPYHWAVATTATLESAVLLTREGVGHGSYRTSNSPCVDSAVDAALISRALPADGTVCTPDAPATTKPLATPPR
ncbi:alpha/beta hydrolase [Cryptosporangium arvum]|uniref:Putative hydrolase or acyltransferase of alpha/beta superfamily n=1 Tax=Cryptosporangium arvum DSM 44712 TaxID=927661 RepID=A0A010ZUI7_9ACTN|nr:alpha/beta hydrolase [Cryptosporangium arvum]EXG82344.1 putative hydrolase or acyltransferase of alpha/beta superfamily [Cryptosporangium arvum DSM 44712]